MKNVDCDGSRRQSKIHLEAGDNDDRAKWWDIH